MPLLRRNFVSIITTIALTPAFMLAQVEKGMDRFVIESEIGPPTISRKVDSETTICKYELGTIKYINRKAAEVNLMSQAELSRIKSTQERIREAQIQQSEAKIEQSRSLQIQVAKSAAYTTAKPQKKLSIISEFIYTNASPEMPEIRLNLDRVYHELVRLELERDKINQQKNIISARESEQWNAIFTNQSKDDYDRVLNRRAELRTQLDYLNAEFNTNWQKLNKIEDEARWICNIFESTASEAAAQNIKSVDIKPKTSPKPIRK